MRPLGAHGSVRLAGPPGWRRIPPVTRLTLLLTAVGYLAGVFHLFPVEVLTAIPRAIVPGGQAWRLVTYPLVNIGIVSVLFDLLLLWSFGSELEPQWGSKAYALFLLLATVTAGVLGIAAVFALGSEFGAGYGFAGTITAVIFAWMLEAPNASTSFFGILPMTRKGFALIALVVVAFGELEQTHSLARLVFVLGGIPAAWLWARRRRRRSLPFSFREPRILRRRRFRVVKGDDERIH
ncbi:MAG TPA: rhomboid family intramembrane serine protease [Thermoanaerobaculia bacterium]|nr:rhomboid family intramembrane serine protease [Thermoanaerobaculia bacterium]